MVPGGASTPLERQTCVTKLAGDRDLPRNVDRLAKRTFRSTRRASIIQLSSRG